MEEEDRKELAYLRLEVRRLRRSNQRLRLRLRTLYDRSHKYEMLLWEIGNLPKHASTVTDVDKA